MGNNKRTIVISIVVVIVVLVVWAVWYSEIPGRTPSLQSSSSNSGLPTATGTSATDTALPAGVTVPNKGGATTTLAANVAVPIVQSAGDPSGNVSYRSFTIAIQNGAYTPDTVIVNQGDTVNLELTAVDAAYGFTQPDYGFNMAIPEGKTQTIQFQALQPGNFTFYCASCGGPSKGPVGHIMVVAN